MYIVICDVNLINTCNQIDRHNELFHVEISSSEPTYQNYSLRGNVSILNGTIGIYCSPYYYGENCSVYCNANNGSGHFTCDKITGNKECLTDYHGVNCTTYCNGVECNGNNTVTSYSAYTTTWIHSTTSPSSIFVTGSSQVTRSTWESMPRSLIAIYTTRRAEMHSSTLAHVPSTFVEHVSLTTPLSSYQSAVYTSLSTTKALNVNTSIRESMSRSLIAIYTTSRKEMHSSPFAHVPSIFVEHVSLTTPLSSYQSAVYTSLSTIKALNVNTSIRESMSRSLTAIYTTSREEMHSSPFAHVPSTFVEHVSLTTPLSSYQSAVYTSLSTTKAFNVNTSIRESMSRSLTAIYTTSREEMHSSPFAHVPSTFVEHVSLTTPLSSYQSAVYTSLSTTKAGKKKPSQKSKQGRWITSTVGIITLSLVIIFCLVIVVLVTVLFVRGR